MKEKFLEWISANTSLIAGGFAGSIIGAAFSRPRGYLEAFVTFLAGFCAALFLPAWLDHFVWKVPTPQMLGGLGFALGLLGKEIALRIYRSGRKAVKHVQVGDLDR